MVKNMPAMQETWVQSLVSPGEEKGFPLQYSWLENSVAREETGRSQSMGSQRVESDWVTKTNVCVHVFM